MVLNLRTRQPISYLMFNFLVGVIMKKQILPFVKLSLLCSVLLSTAALAMEPAQESNQRARRPLPLIPPALAINIPQIGEQETDCKTLNYPLTPVITYGDLVTILMLGDDINGWGNMTGNISSWLQVPENKARLKDKDGVDLEDFPFFRSTLNPYVDGGKLCAFYIFDLPDDLPEDPGYFTLYHDANPEQLDIVNRLEPDSSFCDRIDAWESLLREKQAFTRAKMIGSRFNDYRFTPNVCHVEEFADLDLKFYEASQRRKVGNFMHLFLNFGDLKRNTHEARISNLIGTPSEKMLQDYKKTSRTVGISFLDGNEEEFSTFYYVGNEDYTIASPKLLFNKCFFDTNGTLAFTAEEMDFRGLRFGDDGSMFHCMGPLTLLSPSNKNCPIEKICIYPADSKYPIFMAGVVEFKEIPEILLQAYNVDRIHVIQKKEDE